MKPTIMATLLSLIIGFGSGWYFKPEKEVSTQDRLVNRSSRRAESSSTAVAQKKREAKKEPVETSDRKDHKPQKPQKPQKSGPEIRAEILQRKFYAQFDSKILGIIKELGLNTSQEEFLRDYYEEQMEMLVNVEAHNIWPKTENPRSSLVAVYRDEHLNNYMKSVLSEEQVEGLKVIQERSKKSNIEGQALKNLAKIHQRLNLSDEQKQDVHDIMFGEIEMSLAAQSDGELLVRTLDFYRGVEVDFDDMKLGDMKLSQTTPLETGEDGSFKSMIAVMRRAQEMKLEAKVARFKPILNDIQLEQYEEVLKDHNWQLGLYDDPEAETAE